MRRVCIIGPEATGKTTLADRLARHYDTVMVGEFARTLVDVSGRRVSDHLFPMILKGQAASEAAMARQANRVLICDSDAFTTMLYRRLFFGDCPDYLRAEAERERYDLYLADHAGYAGRQRSAAQPPRAAQLVLRAIRRVAHAPRGQLRRRQRLVGRALRGGHAAIDALLAAKAIP